MTIALWVYVVLGIIALGMSLTMLIAIVRIWQILSEIVSSGAIPGVLEARVKRDAYGILKMEYIHNPQKVAMIIRSLSGMTDDTEAIELSQKLNQLKERLAKSI
jgi:hypothetical protein